MQNKMNARTKRELEKSIETSKRVALWNSSHPKSRQVMRREDRKFLFKEIRKNYPKVSREYIKSLVEECMKKRKEL